MITNQKDLVQRCGVTVCHFSQYNFTRAQLRVSKERNPIKVVTPRCLNKFDFDNFVYLLAGADWAIVYVSATTSDKWYSFLKI